MNSAFIETLYQRKLGSTHQFPDKQTAYEFIDALFTFLFSGKEKTGTRKELEFQFKGLRNTLSTVLFDVLHEEQAVIKAARAFFEQIPRIYLLLLKDAEAILQFDPAAESLEEIFAAYPGFYATAIYRFAHQLYVQKVPALPRLFTEYAHSKTGIDIHPNAEIGASFFIDHGTGIVIGETTVIGDHVKIYQGVTIGALNVAKELARKKRHPTIEDRVIIYSNATILGGDTLVGHDSVIGGNVWLTQSIEPYSVVYHKSEVVVRGRNPLPEPVNFVI